MLFLIFKRNGRCLGTFLLSSYCKIIKNVVIIPDLKISDTRSRALDKLAAITAIDTDFDNEVPVSSARMGEAYNVAK